MTATTATATLEQRDRETAPDRSSGRAPSSKQRTFAFVRGLWHAREREDQATKLGPNKGSLTRGKGIQAWSKRLAREEKQALPARHASQDSFFLAKTKTKSELNANREARSQSESYDALQSPRCPVAVAESEGDAAERGKRRQRRAQAAAMRSLHPELFVQQRGSKDDDDRSKLVRTTQR
jgi:hypothetical protein